MPNYKKLALEAMSPEVSESQRETNRWLSHAPDDWNTSLDLGPSDAPVGLSEWSEHVPENWTLPDVGPGRAPPRRAAAPSRSSSPPPSFDFASIGKSVHDFTEPLLMEGRYRPPVNPIYPPFKGAEPDLSPPPSPYPETTEFDLGLQSEMAAYHDLDNPVVTSDAEGQYVSWDGAEGRRSEALKSEEDYQMFLDWIQSLRPRKM